MSGSNIAEHYWHDFKNIDPGKVFNQNDAGGFRFELAKIDDELALIRDIADSHKHLILKRPSRSITSGNQVDTKTIGFGEVFGLCFGGGDVIFIQLDNGKTEYFTSIAGFVFNFWKDKINNDCI